VIRISAPRSRSAILPLALLLLSAAAPAGAQEVLRFREDAEGELSAADPVLDDGSHYDLWRFPVQAGRAYAVYLQADGFEGVLAVGRQVVPRCEPCAHGVREADLPFSQAQLVAEGDGTYLVRVSGARPGATGRYIVSVHDESSFDPDLPPLEEKLYIQAGQEVVGELTADEEADVWHYAGRAGERLLITLDSDDFDALAVVEWWLVDHFEEAGLDDDGGGGTNSRLEVTLPVDAEYHIRAAPLVRGGTGTYTLRVTRP
jgi:hypothetical protein